ATPLHDRLSVAHVKSDVLLPDTSLKDKHFKKHLQATKVLINPVKFNPDFMAIEGYGSDEKFLKKVHHMVLKTDVWEGTPQCLESGHLLPISHSISDMLL
ncbi:hypothetical protein E2I00_006108, partial [Balaenoptera physalus]